MNRHRLTLAAVLAVLTSATMLSTATAADSAIRGKIGISAVWQLPAQFLTSAHTACDKSSGSHFEDCFIAQMVKAGAGADAVDFSRELSKRNHGDVGIMTGFQSVGPVDIAWITYPLRANTNYGLLLVNGQPEIVDVEDLKQLDTKTMEQSPQFQNLKSQFPQVSVWPGDRDGKTWPNSQPGPNGGLQFVVNYPLLNGCHACASAGFALFTWNFNPQGKFTGTTFQGMTPPPLP